MQNQERSVPFCFWSSLCCTDFILGQNCFLWLLLKQREPFGESNSTEDFSLAELLRYWWICFRGIVLGTLLAPVLHTLKMKTILSTSNLIPFRRTLKAQLGRVAHGCIAMCGEQTQSHSPLCSHCGDGLKKCYGEHIVKTSSSENRGTGAISSQSGDVNCSYTGFRLGQEACVYV